MRWSRFMVMLASAAIVAAGLTAAVMVAVAVAKPPDGAPGLYSAWFEGLHQPHGGLACCSIADCRNVTYRAAGAHFEAYLTRTLFPGEIDNDQWVTVPDRVVLHGEPNPTGEGVLCLFHGTVMCFVPASGT